MKPLTFWRTLRTILSDARAYPALLTTSGWFVFRFWMMVALLAGLVHSALFWQRDLPQLKTWVDTAAQELESNYPPELELSWSGSSLSTNQNEPVIIHYPSFIDPSRWELPAELAVITSQESGQPPTQALFVVTPTQLTTTQAVQSNQSTVPLTSLLTERPLTLSHSNLKEMVNQLVDESQSFLSALALITTVAFPLFILVYYGWVAVINTFFIYILFRLYRSRLGLGPLLKLSVLLIAAGTVVNTLAQVLYHQLSLPLTSLTYWLMLAVITWTNRAVWFTPVKKP